MNMPGKTISAWALPERQREPMGIERQESEARAALSPREREEVVAEAEEFDWIRRARCGDQAAFDWLMTRYRERALRLAAHVLRRPAEAEDLVQEAFLRAFAQIRDFRGEAAFYTWLYRIIVRLCLNRMRMPAWKQEYDLSERFDLNQIETETAATDQIENRILVEALLDRLSPPLRAALVLRELEGLDYEEIAETLQVPVGTVRSRLHAARIQFRDLWQRVQEDSNHV